MSDPPCEKTDFMVNDDGSITVDEITIPAPPVPALTCEATRERLIITELAVRDFKSYAGSLTIGPFNKNFSCIVGPNGSGKSNVIDALLFVFGYRAQKIRSKKVSVLIHKSHKYPDLDSCSVTVKFATIKEEGKSYSVLPDSCFYVTRTGYRDNSSTYEINGRRAQYKDVGALLRKYGIDLDYNRFMILQGEIELISMMKPKAPNEQDSGMLEYIEDIIGSNRFIKPIQHFQSKVDEVNETRMEKLNQFKVVEKERTEAEKPRNKALEYLRLANKVIWAENSVFQAQIRDATEEEENLNENKNVLTKKIEDLTNSLNGLQAEKDLKEMQLRDIASEFDDRAKTVEEYKQQFNNLEREDAACRENIKNNKDKCKKLTKSLEVEELKVMNLVKQPEVLRSEIDELVSMRDKLSTQRAVEEEKLTEVMGSVKDEIKEFQDEQDSLESKLIDLKHVVNEKKSELDLAQSELDLVQSSEKKEKENLDTLQADHEKIVSLIKEEEIALKEANKRLPELESQLVTAEKELITKEKREIVLTEELKTKRIKVDEAKSSLNASVKRSTLVRAFMDQKNKGKLAGVYGRLGDLGAVDAKYDVAISTACGPLDNIVTDTMNTAQECVEFLKANNLGYATFIALDQMKKWEPYTKEKISAPEGVPRLFDLISVKDKSVLTAFYYALRNTLVAKDLDQATRVGLQGTTRHRVVSLKGELVDSAGTMSGGGGQSLKGRMGNSVSDNSVSPQEVEMMNQDIENLVNELTDVKKSIANLKEVIEERKKEIAILQHSMKKSNLNFTGYVEREKMLLKQIEEQKVKIVQAAPDQRKIVALEKQIQMHEKEYTKATNAALVIENKVKGLQEQILCITKGKYGSAQKKIDKIKKEIDQASKNITKNTALLKTTEKNLKKAEEKISSLKEDLQTCQNTLESLKTEFKTLESKGLEVSDQKKQAEEALLVFQFQKALVTGEVKEFSTKMHEIKTEVIDLKNKSKMLDIELRTSKARIKAFKDKLFKLELHDIEEGPTTLPTLSAEELNSVSVGSEEYEIGKMKAQIKEMNPDLGAIAEFKRKEEMYKAKLKDLDDTTARRDHYRQQYDNLRKHRLQEFMRGFSIITLKVKELYQMMTLGGDAELELVDSVDPFSEGIEFSVRPLRKSWKSIRNLSGGEKTLSSLSLVFALHFYRSTPFFVMDEIDAALDFRNVSIIGSYIKDCTKNAQFIVISLRENMFLLADHLIGIYKTNNRTKNVYLSPPQKDEPPAIKTTNTRKSTEPTEETAFDNLLNLGLAEEKNKNANKLDDSKQHEKGNFLNNSPKVTVINACNENKTDSKSKDVDEDDSFIISKSAPKTPLTTISAYKENKTDAENKNLDEDDSFIISSSARKVPKKISTAAADFTLNDTSSSQCLKTSNRERSSKADRSNLSRLRTPKRKIAEVANETKWSDDEDFVIKTPDVSKRS